MSAPVLTTIEEKYLNGSDKLLRRYFETWIRQLEEKVDAKPVDSAPKKKVHYSEIVNEDESHTLQEDIEAVFDAFKTNRDELDQLQSGLAELSKTTAALAQASTQASPATKLQKEMKEAIASVQQLSSSVSSLADRMSSLENNVAALKTARTAQPPTPPPASTIDDAIVKALVAWATETGARIGMPFKK